MITGEIRLKNKEVAFAISLTDMLTAIGNCLYDTEPRIEENKT